MKIKHTITRDGCTLSGKILETIFEGDEKRGDGKFMLFGRRFYIKSSEFPELKSVILYVHGKCAEDDLKILEFTYNSEQEAQEMLDAINSITIKEPTVPEEKWVYVSDESEEFALTHKTKRLLVVDLGEKFCPRYIVTMGDYSSGWTSWLYAVSVPPAPVKKLRQVEMTDEEYEKFISTNS